MFIATLRRQTTITKAEEFDQRKTALLARLLPYLQQQPGFISHELVRDDDAGAMVEVTRWATDNDRQRYLRGGAAAMAATWLDGYLPTAPYPNGTWLREYATE